MDLSGRTKVIDIQSSIAIVTGAGNGIGRAVSRAFAKYGSTGLVLVDRDNNGLLDTKRLIQELTPSVRVELLAQDLLQERVSDQIVSETVTTFGRVDYLVNCAGNPGGFFYAHEADVSMFDLVHSLNVRATWLLQRAVIRQLLKQEPCNGERGSIVNIGSVVSHVGQPMLSAYVSSKHAVLGMTKVEALDYAKHGIRVNCVAPGIIDTDLGRAIPEEIRERNLQPIIDGTALGRKGTTEEVANCVAFLSSRLASYVTGTSLVVSSAY
ncbi:uncharacterized protein A1O5_13361 [Cladophialophora psammophila CBS 110553]|uniref:3-oxoacyl-[acyl-carrier protein] reductase n=1 Tax=Cladophialophora psammophila CBS 110553 TaxID=1182543 RepID=W9VCQ9_9EURO|nr:uncharacterized protein A1O5_13361 [Cladophialophora psammophila CBS 110553]EXJ53372.1 hypothetical protein A1O5_13361 [Cladophialophora psammophila CBS 110553]